MQHGLVQPPSRAISMIRCAGRGDALGAETVPAPDPVASSNTARWWWACAPIRMTSVIGSLVPPPVTPIPARDSRSCRVVRMMIDDRQSVELTQFTAHQRDASDGDHRVVLALGQAAVIVVDLGLGRGAGGAGFGVVGVAHARGGVLGEDHFPHRPGFGVRSAVSAVIASRPCRPMVTPRLRARSVSSGSGPS